MVKHITFLFNIVRILGSNNNILFGLKYLEIFIMLFQNSFLFFSEEYLMVTTCDIMSHNQIAGIQGGFNMHIITHMHIVCQRGNEIRNRGKSLVDSFIYNIIGKFTESIQFMERIGCIIRVSCITTAITTNELEQESIIKTNLIKG